MTAVAMTAEQAVRDRLLATAAVATLVVARIYPVSIPQKPTLPALMFASSGGQDGVTQEGATGPAYPRISVDAYAADYDQVVALAEAVRAALHGQEWIASDGSRITAFALLQPTDIPRDADADIAPGSPLFHRAADYSVFFGKVD